MIAFVEDTMSPASLLWSYARMKPSGEVDDFFFVDEAGKPLTYHWFRKKMKRLKEQAGILRNIKPGSMRSGGTTQKSEAGVREAVINSFGGWRSTSQQATYNKAVRAQWAASKKAQFAAGIGDFVLE